MTGCTSRDIQNYTNARIFDVLTNLDEHVRRILLYVLRDQPQYFVVSHREHHMILAAMRERDKVQAAYLLEQHLTRFCDTLIAGAQRKQGGGFESATARPSF